VTRTIVAGIPADFLEVMFGTLGPGGVEARLGLAHPDVRVNLTSDRTAFDALAREADAAFLGWGPFRLPAEAIGAGVRWVQTTSAGVPPWLLAALRDHPEVAFTSSKGPMGASMAEHGAALILSLARDLPGHQRDQAARRWREMEETRGMVLLEGKTAAILGVGAVGGHLARILRAGLGMRVLGMARASRGHPHVDRYFTREELLEVLPEADVVALALPRTGETARILDRAALRAMKRGAILVNLSRGGLVDEAALAEALESGALRGAGLDVFEREPLPPESPLWQLPSVVITPHASAVTDAAAEAIVSFWCENIRRFAQGEPLLGTVDRAAGY
jgi:phosphoglycerate dehydrogenase-like enzyme